jgi:hypothetical protein
MHCPCWLGIKELMVMDQGYCGSTNLLRIREGNSDGVDLSGLSLVVAVLWPGPTLFDGNGTGRLYIDEAASPEQLHELDAIFQGKRGGPMEVLASLTPTWLATEVTKIEIDEENDAVSAAIHPFGSIVSHPLKNDVGQPMTIQHVGFAAVLQFDNQIGELAPSEGSEWTDSEMPHHWVSKSGTIGRFSWQMN